MTVVSRCVRCGRVAVESVWWLFSHGQRNGWQHVFRPDGGIRGRGDGGVEVCESSLADAERRSSCGKGSGDEPMGPGMLVD